MHYYNENNPKMAAWLRELIRKNLIPYGVVDERSIREVQPEEIREFIQCHFFAGIGGWPYALRLAGWPEGRPVWTGSCPCQPFSIAGKKKGTEDQRHLWPEFHRLISQVQPSIVFGEQVAGVLGEQWLLGVFGDLEAEGYRVAGANLCGPLVNAPHVRPRLYWMAHTGHLRWRGWPQSKGSGKPTPSILGGVEHPPIEGRKGCGVRRSPQPSYDTKGRPIVTGKTTRGMVNTSSSGRNQGNSEKSSGFDCEADFWGDWTPIVCGDRKTRRIKSGLEPLAYGLPARMVRLHGYGNAIIPPLAAKFVHAAHEAVLCLDP